MLFYVKWHRTRANNKHVACFGCEKGEEYIYTGTIDEDEKTIRGTKNNDCPFEVRAVEQGCRRWTIKVGANRRHNHPLTDYNHRHMSTTKLTEDEIAQLSRNHVKPKQIPKLLKEENLDNVSCQRHVHNALQKIRRTDMGQLNHMQYFFKLLRDHGYHEWHRIANGKPNLSDILFFHPKALELLFRFPYVLIMDATHETIKYGMPLLEIIGVTPTSQNFHVAFAFLKDERTETFMWVLEQLQFLYKYQNVHPQIILTHRELALMRAIEICFPDAKHLLCRRHISKNVEKYLVGIIKTEKYSRAFGRRWRRVVNASTEKEYVIQLQELENVWGKLPGMINYIKKEWLDTYKDKFVTAWTKQYLHFGNETANRVESSHLQLKRWLRTTTKGFVQIFPYMHSNIELQLNEIKNQFEHSLTVAHSVTDYPLFWPLRCKVSHTALKLIDLEYQAREARKDAAVCGCLMRLSYGLPCAHEMSQAEKEGKMIDPHNIHIYWRTLQMEGDAPTCIGQIGDDLYNDVLNKFKQMCVRRTLHLEGDAPSCNGQCWACMIYDTLNEFKQKSPIEKLVVVKKLCDTVRKK